MVKYEPVGPRILIKPDVVTKTESGIQIVSNERMQAANTDTGTILKIGAMAWSDFKDPTPWCEVGDVVQYAKYGAKVLMDKDTDELYIICNDDDILAIIRKEV